MNAPEPPPGDLMSANCLSGTSAIRQFVPSKTYQSNAISLGAFGGDVLTEGNDM